MQHGKMDDAFANIPPYKIIKAEIRKQHPYCMAYVIRVQGYEKKLTVMFPGVFTKVPKWRLRQGIAIASKQVSPEST